MKNQKKNYKIQNKNLIMNSQTFKNVIFFYLYFSQRNLKLISRTVKNYSRSLKRKLKTIK